MPKAAKRQRILQEESKAAGLENVLFGASEDIFAEEDDHELGEGFFEDNVGEVAAKEGRAGRSGEAEAASVDDASGSKRRPAWSDDDAAPLTTHVKQRAQRSRPQAGQTDGGDLHQRSLRKQHVALNPRTQWASAYPSTSDVFSPESADVGHAALSTAGGLRQHASAKGLPPGQLEISRLKDANQHCHSDAAVQVLRFHPNGQVLLTGGLDKKLRFLQVDGVRNSVLQTVHLEDMPITDAAFSGGAVAESAVIVGRRPFTYIYDLQTSRAERLPGPRGSPAKSLERLAVPRGNAQAPSSDAVVAFVGDGGSIPLLSLRSRQWVGSLKMSGNVRALSFNHDGSELLSTGDNGMIHVWDLRMRRCRFAFVDAGAASDSCSLAVSHDGQYVSSGSGAGVVNLYLRSEVEAAAARACSGAVPSGSCRVTVAPVHEALNLTTSVDTLEFSPDSQVLAMASRMKRDALRLLHVPTRSVFRNWPTSRSPLGYVHSLEFSPECGMLAVGNAGGRALLYRLHHYQRA